MNLPRQELGRYILNGLVATAVHYAMLEFYIRMLGEGMAGVSNMMAAACGIATSYLGNRYFVFPKSDDGSLVQAMKFLCLYAVLALLQGMMMWLWADRLHLDYRLGFILATFLQFCLSYCGNKFLVFKT